MENDEKWEEKCRDADFTLLRYRRSINSNALTYLRVARKKCLRNFLGFAFSRKGKLRFSFSHYSSWKMKRLNVRFWNIFDENVTEKYTMNGNCYEKIEISGFFEQRKNLFFLWCGKNFMTVSRFHVNVLNF